MFSSKNFIVSDLTFRYIIHFVFTFVYGVRKGSSFIHLQTVGLMGGISKDERLHRQFLYLVPCDISRKFYACRFSILDVVRVPVK